MPKIPVVYEIYERRVVAKNKTMTFDLLDPPAAKYTRLFALDTKAEVDGDSDLILQTEILHDHFTTFAKTAAFKRWEADNKVDIDETRRSTSRYNQNTGKWDYGPTAALNYPIIPEGDGIADVLLYLHVRVDS
ncbi:MAG TPA: hypothetical protein VFZ65_05205 [Planctomycetota bacterium]|nr:hypothetical protein [Planctomycetota bacterium]